MVSLGSVCWLDGWCPRLLQRSRKEHIEGEDCSDECVACDCLHCDFAECVAIRPPGREPDVESVNGAAEREC